MAAKVATSKMAVILRIWTQDLHLRICYICVCIGKYKSNIVRAECEFCEVSSTEAARLLLGYEQTVTVEGERIMLYSSDLPICVLLQHTCCCNSIPHLANVWPNEQKSILTAITYTNTHVRVTLSDQ